MAWSIVPDTVGVGMKVHKGGYWWGSVAAPRSTYKKRPKTQGLGANPLAYPRSTMVFWLKVVLTLFAGFTALTLVVVDIATRGQVIGFVLLGGGGLLWLASLIVGGVFGLTLPITWLCQRNRISAVLGEEVDWH